MNVIGHPLTLASMSLHAVIISPRIKLSTSPRMVITQKFWTKTGFKPNKVPLRATNQDFTPSQS